MKNTKNNYYAFILLGIVFTGSSVHAFGFPVQVRNHLVGEMLTTPVIVEGQQGTTVISGNTIVNPGYIVSMDERNPACLLEARVAEHGNRVVMRNNRIMNYGVISHVNHGEAALAVVSGGPTTNNKTQVETTGNTFQNRGVVTSH